MNSSTKPPPRNKGSNPSASAWSKGPASSALNTPRAQPPARNAPDVSPSQSQRRLILGPNGRQETVEPSTGRDAPAVDITNRPANLTLGPSVLMEHIMSTNRSAFSTNEIRNWHHPRLKNSKTFTTNYPADDFPIGIYLIDIGRGHNVRLKAFANNVEPAETGHYRQFKADFHLDAWADTRLFAAGCCWLDVSKHSTDFQLGRYETGRLSGETSGEIRFEGQYRVAPKIVLWLSTIDIDKSNYSRIRAFATDINTRGFRLHVSTWAKTFVHDAAVSWIAVPSDRPNMTAGDFNLRDGGRITFDKRFKHTPRVLVALNHLDISNNFNLRIEATAQNITKEGVTLSIKSWEDTIIYDAGVSYIAIEGFSPVVD